MGLPGGPPPPTGPSPLLGQPSLGGPSAIYPAGSVPFYQFTPYVPGITQVGTFASGQKVVVAGIDLFPGQDLLVLGTATAVAHTYTTQPAGGTATGTRPVPAGVVGAVFRGGMYRNIKIDAADAQVSWEVGPEGAFGSQAVFQVGSPVLLKPTGSQTIVLPNATSFGIQNRNLVDIFRVTEGGAGADTFTSGVGLQLFAATALSTTNATLLSLGSTASPFLQTINGAGDIQLTNLGNTVGSIIIRNSDGALLIARTIVQYNAVATAGLGVGAIYAHAPAGSRTTTQTNLINYTPSANIGKFVLFCEQIVTATTGTTAATLTFKDASGASRTVTILFTKTDGTTSAAPAAIGVWSGNFSFSIDATAAAITLTFTVSATATYWPSATLVQMA